MSIQQVQPISEPIYTSHRQERIEEVKEEVKRPPNEISVTRVLHHHGFNFNDLTNIEKIDLFI